MNGIQPSKGGTASASAPRVRVENHILDKNGKWIKKEIKKDGK
jgi:hypothetical protein